MVYIIILAIWRALGSTKEGKKVNVLCIVAQKHERSMFVLDHFRDFEEIEDRKVKN